MIKPIAIFCLWYGVRSGLRDGVSTFWSMHMQALPTGYILTEAVFDKDTL